MLNVLRQGHPTLTGNPTVVTVSSCTDQQTSNQACYIIIQTPHNTCCNVKKYTCRSLYLSQGLKGRERLCQTQNDHAGSFTSGSLHVKVKLDASVVEEVN